MIVGRENTVLDERTDALGSESVAETHVVIALVSSQTEQVACVSQGDLRADVRSVGPLRTTVNVDHRALRGIDEKRCLDRSYVSITPLEVVARRLPTIEVSGVDGGVTRLVEQLRRELEQLARQPSVRGRRTCTARMDQ